jgi:hypothetical protein
MRSEPRRRRDRFEVVVARTESCEAVFRQLAGRRRHDQRRVGFFSRYDIWRVIDLVAGAGGERQQDRQNQGFLHEPA